ncbi:MAG TPA: CDP-alcohol phosphatidyltransferase family protein [Gemmatimonadota bacterium]|nr:CDP-alcohol phosphatidyltransferase family protein [Gemmatimonadota bacterium]
MPDWFKNAFVGLLDPVVGALVRRRVHPNLISSLGFLVTLAAAVVIFQRHLFWGSVVFLLGGMMDILDGRVARETGLASKFGSFYDSTLDRVSEIVVYFSLYAYFRPMDNFWWVGYVVILAMVGSLMVSYTRAKAEALGVDCKIGMMQRPERVVALGVGGLLVPVAAAIGPRWEYAPLLLAIGFIAVLANFTAIERIHSVYTLARGVPLDEPPHSRSSPMSGGFPEDRDDG